jgi:hypothetical protein
VTNNWSGMGLNFKRIILILLIITGFSEWYGRDIKFRQLNKNDELYQNAVFKDLKEQIWIVEKYLCKLSDMENRICSRSVHLEFPSSNNYRNS